MVLSLLNPNSHLSRARVKWLAFLNALELCVATPHVTSWWRTEQHNREVGGLPNSKHLTGDAIDVVWQDAQPDPGALLRMCARYELRLVREGDHEHFQFEVP